MGKTGDYSCSRGQAAIGPTFVVNGWALPLQCTQLCTTVQSPYSALSALGAQGRGWRSMYSMTCVRVFKTSQSPGEVFIKYSHPWESLLMIDDDDVGTREQERLGTYRQYSLSNATKLHCMVLCYNVIFCNYKGVVMLRKILTAIFLSLTNTT